MRRPNHYVVKWAGPVTVAYKRQDRKWTATALEFDLVGIGNSQVEALVSREWHYR